MRLLNTTLSRRLDRALRVRYLQWLQRSLDKRRVALTQRLDSAAERAQALARLNRFDPVLNDHRRAMRVDRLIVDERLAVVNRRLKTLGAAA